MRTLLLMVVFGLGSLFLLPRPARSLDDCVACDCKEMKAWKQVNQTDLPGTYGLRMQDPNNNKNYIAVEHVPDVKTISGGVARWLSTASDVGVRTLQFDANQNAILYGMCKYNQASDIDCKVAANENGWSVVRATFTKEADWNDYQWHGTIGIHWAKCAPKQQDPGGGGN